MRRCPDHLAYFISEVVDQLDLSAITGRYQGETRVKRGAAPPYHPGMMVPGMMVPGMMVKLLLYGYCTELASSRRLALRLHEDIGYYVGSPRRR